MTPDQMIAEFVRSAESQQITFLSRLSAEATVWARETYEAGTDNVRDAQRRRTFNEFQHRLAGQLVHLLEHDDRRYPADVFAKMLVEYAEELGCTRALLKTFEQLQQRKAVRASA